MTINNYTVPCEDMVSIINIPAITKRKQCDGERKKIEIRGKEKRDATQLVFNLKHDDGTTVCDDERLDCAPVVSDAQSI